MRQFFRLLFVLFFILFAIYSLFNRGTSFVSDLGNSPYISKAPSEMKVTVFESELRHSYREIESISSESLNKSLSQDELIAKMERNNSQILQQTGRALELTAGLIELYENEAQARKQANSENHSLTISIISLFIAIFSMLPPWIQLMRRRDRTSPTDKR